MIQNGFGVFALDFMQIYDLGGFASEAPSATTTYQLLLTTLWTSLLSTKSLATAHFRKHVCHDLIVYLCVLVNNVIANPHMCDTKAKIA